MEELLFGAAYYPEYMSCDRTEQDMAMMKKAGLKVIIGTPTWYYEPRNMPESFADVRERGRGMCASAGRSPDFFT